MIKNHSFSLLKKIKRILGKIEKQNKEVSRMNFLLLIITIIAVGVAIISSSLLYIEARNSSQTAIDALNETRKLVEWTLPKPIITIETNLPHIGKNNSIVLEVCDVEPDEGFNPNVVPYGKELKISFFNAGRIPLYTPRIYIKINSSSNVKFFPFKIKYVITTISNLYYDGTDMTESLWLNYPIGEPEQSSYCHPIVTVTNYTCGFPPDYIYGLNNKTGMFSVLILPIPFNLPDNDMTDKTMGIFNDNIGPFLLGDIDPVESKDCFIYLFAVAKNHSEERIKSWDGLRNNIYAEGNLTVILKADNYEKTTFVFPLISCFNEFQIK